VIVEHEHVAAAPVGTPAPPAAVSIHHVSKTYSDGRSRIKALDDVSLDIAEGEFVCLLGASGCGKSTLLSLVSGLYATTEGTIDTGGRRSGMVFQAPALFPWLTVARNVDAAMKFQGLPRDLRKSRVNELLKLVHLEEFADERPHQLSGGMRQRTAIARALAQDAELLLMDEPFGALDAMTRGILHDEIERIWSSSNLTVLFVTHDVREAVRLGDRVVLLSSRPGRVIETYEVGLPRPRELEAAAVGDLAAEITARLRGEVRRHAS
jgi:NitT/TauT family transport system ATP-binding protein